MSFPSSPSRRSRRVIAGFLFLVGFVSIAGGLRHVRAHHLARRAAFESYVAKTCVDAARESGETRGSPTSPTAP